MEWVRSPAPTLVRPPQLSRRFGHLSLSPSPPRYPQAGEGCGDLGMKWGARQVERVEASRAGDLGQTVVGGLAQVVPGAKFVPVLRTPGLKSRSLGLQILGERSLKSGSLNGTLWAPPPQFLLGKPDAILSCIPLCQT